MEDPRQRQTFFEMCEGKMKRDINGVFYGTLLGEQVYDVFKKAQLVCTFCGHVSKTRIQHKYHMTCYCAEFQKAHHEGE